MDLFLARLAGSPPPARERIAVALARRGWLTLARGEEAPRGTFRFPGGALVISSDAGRARAVYAPPWIHVDLTRAADHAWVAPRLLSLAPELELGVDSEPP